MGAVYKARHQHLDKLVAVKVLPAQFMQQAESVARFKREMKAVGRISHPSIVQAFDAGEINGTHFLAMEYVEGADLHHLVKAKGVLSVQSACKVVRQAALALSAAHGAGLVHRDVKPLNLLVSKKGQVKLLDLGLALLSEDAAVATQMTTAGQAFGTPDYMAPEQWVDAHSADARSDLYALGCTLFFVLTGRAPYGDDKHRHPFNKMSGHCAEPIPDLKVARSTVPDEVVAIYQKLMAKKPDDRFQTAAELAEALAPFALPKGTAAFAVNSPDTSGAQETQPYPATQPPAPPPTTTPAGTGPRRPSSRLRLAAAGAAALMLFGVIVITITNKDGTKTTVEVPEGVETEVEVAPGSRVKITQSVAKPSEDAAVWHRWPKDAPKPAIAPFDSTQAKRHQEEWAAHLKVPVEYTNSIGMKFRLIPPGEFMMGSTPEEIESAIKVVGEEKDWQAWIKSESPQHKVILTQPFYLGMNEVTQAEYENVMGVNPSYFTPTRAGKEATGSIDTSRHPVESVSWNDAAEFATTLSLQEHHKPYYFRAGETITPLDGTGYRLPSEAEWEFACRAGTITKYSTGDSDDDLVRAGWFGQNSGGRTHAVGELTANPFGLFDVHGNVWEWVQDGWDATAYGRFTENPVINPISPFSSGGTRVIRGGRWYGIASACRSSHRNSENPTTGNRRLGFRVSLPVDAVRWSRIAGETKPLAYRTPGFDQWMKDVQALSADQQVRAVSQKLVELNPGFDGKVTPTISEGVVTQIEFFTDNVTDISPVRALVGLNGLYCPGRADGNGGKLSDLSPLRGLPLKALNIHFNRVADLAPLQGMPLVHLFSAGTRIADLSPLQSMPLTHLQIEGTQVSDLSPLKGMPLTSLFTQNTQASDLSPLQGMSLTTLLLDQTQVSDLSPLKDMPLQQLELHFTPNWDTALLRSIKTLETINGKPAAEFYKAVEDHQAAAKRPLAFETPEFEQWVKETTALPAEQQVEAVSKKLAKLNPGFDGKVTGGAGIDEPVIENGVVKSLVFLADNVTDISPLRALEGLSSLSIAGGPGGKGQLLNLSPLRGLPLTYLYINSTKVSDLSPLRGMKLTSLNCSQTFVSDLSPLKEMKLESLDCGATRVHDITPLKGMPLTELNMNATLVSDLSPLQGMKLTFLSCYATLVADLSPLKGMPIKGLNYVHPERHTELLRSIKTLETINGQPAAEFWKEVEKQKP